VKNLLKFISIGLVLMLVVFSQVTQQSSAVEAADVSQNDLDFMDTADAVVKSYKASSTDTKVYLYVRDNDLNTTHTGTTEWASTHPTIERVVDETSTWKLDTNDIVLASIKEQAVTGALALVSGHDSGLHNNGATATTYNELATTTNGQGWGLTVDCTITNSGDAANDKVTACTTGAVPGMGYAAGDTITVLQATMGGTQNANMVLTASTVTNVNSVAVNFDKVEDSDQGVTGGPDLYEGSDTSLKLNTLTIKKGSSSLVIDQLNESLGTFSLNADVNIGDTAGSDTVVASYSFSAQDVYTALSSGIRATCYVNSLAAT
jgi:hypothetical protein